MLWRLLFPKPKAIESMKRKCLSDVIELVKKTKSRRVKVNIIQSNMCPGLSGLLRMNFDSSLQLDIDLDLKFRSRKESDFDETLNHSARIWHSFTRASVHTRQKKNLRLKAMLERLEPREAQLFLDAGCQKLNLGISIYTLRRCFPKLFKDRI